MKTKIFLGASVILILIQVNLSCKKETSCEACKRRNEPPVAIAGADQRITLPVDSVFLDGNGSRDPDGSLADYQWTKLAGPVSYLINNRSALRTIVNRLLPGVYQFELKVMDNESLSARDTVQVVVEDPANPNRQPVANAGADQEIRLPLNTVYLDGSLSSDPDNNITSYQWINIAGPVPVTISNTVQVPVGNLVQGFYLFELKVTDAGGLFSKDTVRVTVLNFLPACTDCRIAFVSTRDGNDEIYSCNADGSNVIRLTTNAAYDDDPAWSPDGTKIAFISDRSGHTELYIMNSDGSNVVRRTYTDSYASNPAWSPDGTKIVYSGMSNGSMNIWVIDAAIGSPSLLFEAPGWDSQPKWSPDGTKIVVVSDWMAYDFVYDIYTINANGSGFTTLTGNIFDHVDYLNPSWSPNGAKLAIAISETIGIDQYRTQVGIMNPDGSGIAVLVSGAAAWTRTSWSGDGMRIAYTSMSGLQKDVSWVSADRSSWGTIVTNGWNADWQH